MKVLWLCNIMLPAIAQALKMEASNKEGWLSGLADMVLGRQRENGIELAAAFPAPEGMCGAKQEVHAGKAEISGGNIRFYGFRENTVRAEAYDRELEKRMNIILDDFKPDVVHCFGSEYPHTLAMCRVFPRRDRILIGIQGLCTACAEAYFADMPERAVKAVTFRDFLKKDSIVQQQRKFAARGEMEREAVKLAGNISGRTQWDREYTARWNPDAVYHSMNETLRQNFYGDFWQKEKCRPHSIFLSQGDYPIKGLHYMLQALPVLRERYPDIRVTVAGDNLVRFETWKDKLKLSGYGKYLRGLIRENNLEKCVFFPGRLSAEQMKEQYLENSLFVCCSSVENSPNSLGEAMLLGMPCVSADVGGIPSIFTAGEDGISYRGFRISDGESGPEAVAARLAEAVSEMWEDSEKAQKYCINARKHAKETHDREKNYQRLLEIYGKIVR